MKISTEKPPIYDRAAQVFDIPATAVFTYGDTIFSPSGATNFSVDLVAHEKVHMRQQGDNPEEWWELYLTNREFRLEQEVEAYREQYRVYCNGESRSAKRFKFLQTIASDLASPMYDVDITLFGAMKMIRNGM
jgi:hypothetical protein